MPKAYDPARFERVRWTIYSVLIAAYMLVFFHRFAPAMVSGELTEAFGVTAAALGSLSAMYFYIYTAMQMPAGVLADTLGSRFAVMLGNAVAGCGSIVFGLAETLATASVGRFLVGLGVSVVFVGLMKSNSVWFSERKYGSISGLTLLLGNLGAIAATGPLALMLLVVDWRSLFVALGVIAIGLAVLSWWLVRDKPEQMGFPSVREMEGLPPATPRQQHWIRDLKSVVSNRRLWPGFIYDFGITGSLFGMLGLWAIPLLRDVHGLSRGDASLYTTLATVAFAIGCLVAGNVSDRLGRRRPVLQAGALAYLGMCLGLLLLPWGPGALGLTLFILLGLSAGCFVVAYAHAKEVAPPAFSGMAIALVNTGLFLGAALFQPLFGWVMDLGWDGTLSATGAPVYDAGDYQRGLWLLTGFAALATVASWLLVETRGKNIVED
ncbi:MFS transporter [Ectothiorhodospira variabilis]|uniref:MFS transporter n=1 Tax=Ectothiorhodospira variabilis TaxID=505694 RepID=UPI001EFB33EE|nr:MFS transporter [Ectothiorhodospira variabilis]MCG5494721.1 MFS transporter [Ectothiorhodospira variabilis]MCG5503515.1 MFS transporter [Ectothiorhodospira variabilis]MCG5506770.1 MFS transporter [Ectothiorhodospira variabilis]